MDGRLISIAHAVFLFLFMTTNFLAAKSPIVIAHRGASGYLPEHTLAAKAMAHAFGSDYLEQDVVLTRDDQPIVVHDIYLETICNVKDVFPDRHRADGRFYAIDFTLAEIKTLTVHERVSEKTGKAVYARRFPVGKSTFAIPTLAEEIELVQGLNQSTSRSAGIYTEIKSPAWHREQGKDISRIVLELLGRYGYVAADSNAFIQCFDPAETRRMRSELGCKMKLIQLIDGDSWNEQAGTLNDSDYPGGLPAIAQYAQGIGPAISDVVRFTAGSSQPQVTSLTTRAHQLGLLVHPYTLRADSLPKEVTSFEQLYEILVKQARVDGLFTDFPDRAIAARDP